MTCYKIGIIINKYIAGHQFTIYIDVAKIYNTCIICMHVVCGLCMWCVDYVRGA